MLFVRFRILGKLTLLVLVPLLGVVALTVPIVVNRIQVANSAQRTADVVDLAREVGSTLQEIQEERLLSMGFLFGLVQRPELVVQSAKVDDRVDRLTRLDLTIAPQLRRALDGVQKLETIRPAVLNRTARPDLLVSDFTAVVTSIINALDLPRHADMRTTAGRQVFALDSVLRIDDMISQVSSLVTAAAVTREPGFVALFSQKLIEVQLAVDTRFAQFATVPQMDLYTLVQESFRSRAGKDFFEVAAVDPAAAVKSLDVNSLFPSLRSTVVLGRFVEHRIAADVAAAVTDSRDQAARGGSVIVVLSVALLLLVFALSLVMARAVARPLHRLTASADRIARTAAAELERVADDETDIARPIHLDPVDVQARDEIGDLARAFERVQATAVQLVERQVAGRRNVAQMFGHVGRRTQNLVGRQLALIDRLERLETDPDRLRELYRLDHMSSRLRRNASSLVVLSGAAGTDDHMAPLALADVVRLALGEIEDYARVDMDIPDDMTVAPAIIADLTLMLAELMENATVFSPPHTRVTVTAVESLGGGARLSIVDHGLGLSPERLAEENARLTRRERLDLVPTEVLGLFVVGRLARRHGFRVSLTDTPQGGVTAWLDLHPQHLLPRPEVTAPGSGAAAGPAGPTEIAPLVAGAAFRSVPGSQQPFDAAALQRATRSLESGQSWNAFARSDHDAGSEVIEPSEVLDPVDRRIPVIAAHDEPHGVTHSEPGAEAMPESPAGMRRTPDDGPFVPTAATGAPVRPTTDVPRQRSGEHVTLKRRVRSAAGPGQDAPRPTTGQPVAPPPTLADAAAARSLVDAFQAGVTRARGEAVAEMDAARDSTQPETADAQVAAPAAGGSEGAPWNGRREPAPAEQRSRPALEVCWQASAVPVIPGQRSAPAQPHMRLNTVDPDAPPAGPATPDHHPLTRRVPGATLPPVAPPAAGPMIATEPKLDPDEARDLIQQFEYGVALALRDADPQPEEQPR